MLHYTVLSIRINKHNDRRNWPLCHTRSHFSPSSSLFCHARWHFSPSSTSSCHTRLHFLHSVAQSWYSTFMGQLLKKQSWVTRLGKNWCKRSSKAARTSKTGFLLVKQQNMHVNVFFFNVILTGCMLSLICASTNSFLKIRDVEVCQI